MRRILFVCTGNTCRSPMAAALYNQKYAQVGSSADSAGLAAFHPAKMSIPARKVLREVYGITADAHEARPVTADLIDRSDLVLTMTREQAAFLAARFPGQKPKIMSLGELAGEPASDVADPYGGDEAAYRKTAGQISRLIERAIPKIKESLPADQGQTPDDRV